MVALTTDAIHGINHATGGISGLQIGDQTGILPAFCTGFVASTCGETQNCVWCRDHTRIYNDTLLFVTGRPIAIGIAYVAVTPVPGAAIFWFSTNSKTWIPGVVVGAFGLHEETFADGSKAQVGILQFSGQQAISGDSGSPVFTATGEFIASIAALGGGGTTIAYWAYPTGSQTRPAGAGGPTGAAYAFSGSVYDYEED